MTESTPERPSPREDAQAVLDTDDSARYSTAARALILGNALASPDALLGIRDDVSKVGLTALPSYWGSWEDRQEAVSRSDSILRQFGVLEDVEERERSGYRSSRSPIQAPTRESLVPAWERLVESGSVPDAIAWLRLLMTDEEPVAATAAAVALASWRKRRGVEVPMPLAVAPGIVAETAADSEDNSAEATIARAAAAPRELAVTERRPSREGAPVGAMIHGTWGWPGTWWEPGGDFHTFVKGNVCPDIYSGGMPFNWNGAYRGRHRRIAAERLARWAEDAAGGELCCVYAHSYGGVIALMATAFGVKIETLVLLSVPSEQVPVEWRNVQRAVSLRIHMDLVLLAARRRQKFTENVEENWLPSWFVQHGDSHDPQVWLDSDCQKTLSL